MLDKECYAGYQKEVLNGDLLHDLTDQSHGGEFEECGATDSDAHLCLGAAERCYDLDHVVVDRVVCKEETDSAQNEQHEGRIGLNKADEIIVGNFGFGRCFSLELRLFEEVQNDQSNRQEYDVQDHEDVYAEPADSLTCKHGCDRESAGSESSCEAVVDVASSRFVFEIHRRDDWLVDHLYHVDQRENDEYHGYSILNEQQQD